MTKAEEIKAKKIDLVTGQVEYLVNREHSSKA